MTTLQSGSIIGIVGGGQLGRMTAIAAAQLGLKVHIYSDKENCPGSQVANHTVVGDFANADAMLAFAKACDVITFEFENIPFESVKALSDAGVSVRPGWNALHITQNRLREKDFVNDVGFATAEYVKVDSATSFEKAYRDIGTDGAILKTIELGYDGKGQMFVDKNTEFASVWNAFGAPVGVLESLVPFTKEISVIVARDDDGNMLPFMPSENIHKDGILDVSMAPADVEEEVIESAWEIACSLADKLEITGLLAVELFLLEDNTLLVNEMAPRPHNSGHWTMDACVTSQFEQLVRAISGFPFGAANYHSKAMMKNLIGEDVATWQEFANDPFTKIHIYGKEDIRPKRKMGHITSLISDDDVLIEL